MPARLREQGLSLVMHLMTNASGTRLPIMGTPDAMPLPVSAVTCHRYYIGPLAHLPEPMVAPTDWAGKATWLADQVASFAAAGLQAREFGDADDATGGYLLAAEALLRLTAAKLQALVDAEGPGNPDPRDVPGPVTGPGATPGEAPHD